MTRPNNEVHAHAIRPVPRPDPTHDGSHDSVFDWPKLARYALLSLGSIRRRLLLFLFVAAAMVLLAAVALAVLPRSYEVQARLLAQRNPVLAIRTDTSGVDP